MPTYNYECSKCGNVQEEFHSINASPDIACEICKEKCKKIFSASGNFILKGSDWPSQNSKMKDEMTQKNTRMKTKMIERERAGEGVANLGDLKKKIS